MGATQVSPWSERTHVVCGEWDWYRGGAGVLTMMQYVSQFVIAPVGLFR
jgi:hypothetical protein